MVGCCYFAPVTSRVSARQPSYFFLLRQKKVTKKKASHVRAASRCLALLAAFGTLANSLRSNSASVLIRTLLRCSARPNGGGYLTARPLRELRPNGSSASRTSPEWLVRFANFARRACSLRSPRGGWGCLISHASLLSRARHAVPLRQTPSFLIPHASRLTPHFSSWATTRVAPTPSLLRPHSSLLARARHAVPLRQTPSLLTPHSYDLTPHSSLLRQQGSSMACAMGGNFEAGFQVFVFVLIVFTLRPEQAVGDGVAHAGAKAAGQAAV